ncbi:MAG: GIY-YIG nuclease family protein [Selenomonadaceae bacterium]|nr:GIY-YIG nuclease family protein [Selenomonadaceae bacterium]
MDAEVLTHDRFGEVRTITLEGEKYYAGCDVAIALGYRKPRNFVGKHVAKADKRLLPFRAPNRPAAPTLVAINEKGVRALCAAAFSAFANEIEKWLLGEKKPVETPFVEVQGKVGYFDNDNVIWLEAEYVARELGFVLVHKERGTKDGSNYPTAVRWERVNGYLRDFGYDKEVGKGDYLPENMVYRLAMRANSESAIKFQIKIANEILPSIRKYGFYSVEQDKPVEPVIPVVNNKEAMRLKNQLKEIEKFEFAVVYILLMGDGTVKFGVTDNLTRRIKELKAETKLDVLRYKTTAFMSREDALALETRLKEKYAAYNIGGEYYDVRFVDVCKELI